MKMMRALVALAAGASLLGPAAEAQTAQVQPKPVTKPAVQPPRPGGPQIQPPRPVKPQPPKPVKPQPPNPVKPRPPRPEIQPPRPVKPQPPRPVHPRPPVVVHHHYQWNHYNPGWAYGRAVLYSGTYYRGHYVTVRHNIPDLRAYHFNDRAFSINARGRWQICSQPHYQGTCITVRNSDPVLNRLGGRVSSVRYRGH